MSLSVQVQAIRDFYRSGATRSIDFRRGQLRKLSAALDKYETQIYEALYQDLRKSSEESWVTENGFLKSEIRHVLRNLADWMAPEPVATNLVNLPSGSQVMREPLGVVLIIGPWNYPVQLLLMPLISAIAAGNCAVLKAPEQAPASSALMKKMISETFSDKYIILLEGNGHELVPALMREATFDHVFFTGSTQVGKAVYQLAAEKLTPVTLELGGKSPCVIEADANITVAAKRIVLAKFSNAGQMCVAPDYLLVHHTVKDRLIQEMIRCIQQFFGDDPQSSSDYGRIINKPHIDRLTSFLSEGRILHGGRITEDQLYMEPTIIEPSSLDSTVMQEEIFGPILPVLSFDDMAGACSIIERNPDPLAFYIFSSSKKRADAWLQAVPSGGACVNNVSWHLTNHHLPFGGRGNSGIGRYHGKYGFDRLSHLKAVMRTPTWFDPFIKYPPFKGKLRLFKWMIR